MFMVACSGNWVSQRVDGPLTSDSVWEKPDRSLSLPDEAMILSRDQCLSYYKKNSKYEIGIPGKAIT